MLQGAENRRIHFSNTTDLLIIFIPGSLVDHDRPVSVMKDIIEERLPDLDYASSGCGNRTFELGDVSRKPVPRNGYCEIGETIMIPSTSFSGVYRGDFEWIGIEDCFFVMAKCPITERENSSIGTAEKACSGKGICTFAGMASCSCFEGYGGEACDRCSDGFQPRNGHCLPMDPHQSDSDEVPRTIAQQDMEVEKNRLAA